MIGSIALLLLLFGIVIYVTIHHALMREFDASLAESVHIMAACVEVDGDEIEIEFDPARVPELRNKELPSHYEFWCEDGAVLLRSESLGQTNLPRFHGEKDAPGVRSVRLHGGAAGRALGVSFTPAADNEYFIEQENGDSAITSSSEDLPAIILVVARSTRQLDAQMAFFRWLLAGSGGVTMIVALVVSLLIVRRGLRPL
ncbi:unnamed protein product, partial [marine sediment metagenome]